MALLLLNTGEPATRSLKCHEREVTAGGAGIDGRRVLALGAGNGCIATVVYCWNDARRESEVMLLQSNAKMPYIRSDA